MITKIMSDNHIWTYFLHYPEMRPLQMLSLMKEEQDDIKVAHPEVTNTFPKEISHMSKCMNLCKSMHFRQLYGINLLNRYHPTKEEMTVGKDLYEEYLEYAKGFGPGEEYDLIQYFVDTFGLSDFVTISDEHLYTAAYEKKKHENDADHRDDYADEQNARYALEHQDGADPQETLMMAMYMEVAMDHCDKLGARGTQQLAMECAHLGLGGISPSKEYTLHYVSEKKMHGYQVIAFYYVSMACAFPKLLEQIGLPYTKAYVISKFSCNIFKKNNI